MSAACCGWGMYRLLGVNAENRRWMLPQGALGNEAGFAAQVGDGERVDSCRAGASWRLWGEVT